MSWLWVYTLLAFSYRIWMSDVLVGDLKSHAMTLGSAHSYPQLFRHQILSPADASASCHKVGQFTIFTLRTFS